MPLEGFAPLLAQLSAGMTPAPQGMPPSAAAPPARAAAPQPIVRQPSGGRSALDLIAPMLALGTALSGNRGAATGAFSGLAQNEVHRQRQAQIDQDQAMRQQVINEQTAARADAMRIREEAEARRRQEQVLSAVQDVRTQKFKTKAEYDTYVTFVENAIGVRPNTIRGMAPFTAPDMAKPAKDAVDALIKEHGMQILTSGAIVELDRDGDGIMEPVPILEAAQIGKVPSARGADGQPIIPPKAVKPENLQDFDIVFKGLIDKFQVEKKRPPTDAEQGQLALEATEQLSKRRKEGTASVVVQPAPERPFTRFQRAQVERQLRDDADKVLAPIRDMNRQVAVMRAGLDQIQRTGRLDAGTQAIINTFNRILEPGSVTREAEYMRTTLGQPLFESLAGQWQKLSQGGAGVRPESLNLAVELAEQIVDSLSTSADDRLDDLRAQATEFELPADRIVPKRESYRLKPRGGKAPGAANPMRERAKKILQDGGYDTSDASIDKFIANPKNKALLGGGGT
jgi:hypothetical protein